MPYVDAEARLALDSGAKPTSAGELNYLVSKLADDYLVQKGGLRYTHINEVIGVLECAKLELYRRVAVPYEDVKMSETGDVYESIK